MAQSLGHSIDDCNIREKYRAQIANGLKEEFSCDVPLVVHSDGNLMSDLSGNQHVDPLPILVRLPTAEGEQTS